MMGKLKSQTHLLELNGWLFDPGLSRLKEALNGILKRLGQRFGIRYHLGSHDAFR